MLWRWKTSAKHLCLQAAQRKHQARIQKGDGYNAQDNIAAIVIVVMRMEHTTKQSLRESRERGFGAEFPKHGYPNVAWLAWQKTSLYNLQGLSRYLLAPALFQEKDVSVAANSRCRLEDDECSSGFLFHQHEFSDDRGY